MFSAACFDRLAFHSPNVAPHKFAIDRAADRRVPHDLAGSLVVTGRSDECGFGLIESLVVVVIAAVVLALLLPAMTAGREASRSMACRNVLRQMGLALHTYQNYQERFPMGFVAWKGDNPLKTDPGWAWGAIILPELDCENLHKSLDFQVSISMGVAGAQTAPIIKLDRFLCPSDRGGGGFAATSEDGKIFGTFGATSYAGNYGSGGDVAARPGEGNGFFVRNRCFALDDFEDGLSNTFAIGERAAMHTKTAWVGAIDGAVCRITPGAPSRSKMIGRGAVQVLAHIGDKPLNSLDSELDEFFSPHLGGVHFLMGDGAVRFFRSTINHATLRAHATRNGDELISDGKR
jgi:type II secretory pathway pseudopilin PulG